MNDFVPKKKRSGSANVVGKGKNTLRTRRTEKEKLNQKLVERQQNGNKNSREVKGEWEIILREREREKATRARAISTEERRR